MKHVSIVPAVHVDSVDQAALLWTTLGFELAFAFAEDRLVDSDGLGEATFARFDAPSPNSTSVFLDTVNGVSGAVVHLMVESCDDVDEAALLLRGEGFVFDRDPGDRPWGMRDLVVRDPFGNALVVGSLLDGD